MLTGFFAALIGAQGISGLTCPIMGGKVSMGGGFTDFNGVRYMYCCGGCQDEFEKSPTAALANPKMKGKTLGISLFDPISGARIDADRAKGGYVDTNGVRYYFATPDEKKLFKADPKKYATFVKKETLTCPVMGRAVADYASTSGYADYKGVRYYFCCSGCETKFAENPAEYSAKVASSVRAVGVHNAKKPKA